ncbi:MAG: sigma factor, partial [Gammaproteobacteria bacterium]
MTRRLSDFEIDDLTLAAAKRGDLRACESVYRQFQRPAFNVAVRVVHCREMAQEITQEAFITAFRRLKQYRGDAPFWA